MKRLREAGLNPALMYGNSTSTATGNSSSAPEAVGKSKVNIGNPLLEFQNVKNTGLVNDNLREQNKVLQQEATLKNAQALKTIAESNIKGIDLKVAKRTKHLQP